MTDVINLNKARKKKAKEAKERLAETNRRLHGRTKAQRALEALEKKKLDARVDGALRTTSSPNEDDSID